MLYYAGSGGDALDRDMEKPDAFRLVYPFFAPDHWFEVQGGVDRTVTSGWKNR